MQEAIVLSTAWPGDSSGASIALKSSLELYYKKFDKVSFICVSDSYVNEDSKGYIQGDFFHIAIKTQTVVKRFAKSIFSNMPAITMRVLPSKKKIIKTIDTIISDRAIEFFLIIEEAPLVSLLPSIKAIFPNLISAVHTHDVYSKSFEGMPYVGSIFERLLWKIELYKIRRFEKRYLTIPNKHWTITQSDGETFQNILNIPFHGVLDVYLDTNRYLSVENGDLLTIVQVGTRGFLKMTGMKNFIHNAWPYVQKRIPSSKLVIAGKNSEYFSKPDFNIYGIGFVADDRDIYGKGRIVINSQSNGSGLQLKSLVTMLSGKALISTKMATEGVIGVNGVDFLSVDTYREMGECIVETIENPERVSQIGDSARMTVSKHYSKEAFLDRNSKLIDSLFDFANSHYKH